MHADTPTAARRAPAPRGSAHASAGHRHSAGHEHDFEPLPGLPEALPGGESIVWQGRPEWRALALRAFHVRKLGAYFAGLLALRASLVLADGGSALDAARSLNWALPLALLGLGLFSLLAWLTARSALYTVTNRRVVMRIGIVLTLTFNLPLQRIAAADYRAGPLASGDIALTLSGRDRIAWLNLWPHARPWRVNQPQPMLRCLPDAERVARLLVQTWAQATGQQRISAAIQSQPQPDRVRAEPGQWVAS
ncbi:MAG: photosynthetic complex putative assembly protein PuhB [Leptothrix sp. (in: b-proteobacteria)]